MICERSVSRTVLNASTLMACLPHYKQCTPLTLSLLPFDHVSKNLIIRYNLFRIFTYSRTPERAFFCCYFQPNNFSCQTFSASLHSTLHFISNLRVLSWFVFVTRSGIISLSWVKLTSTSVANTVGRPIPSLIKMWTPYWTQSARKLLLNNNQAKHITTMCLAEGIKRPDEWTFQVSSFQTFLGSKGVWQRLKCSSVWPPSKKDFCVILESCRMHTLNSLNTTVNTNKLKLQFRTDAAKKEKKYFSELTTASSKESKCNNQTK